MTRHTELQSPCLGVCVIDARSNRCHGCFRTPNEIQVWPRATDSQKRTILAELRQRRTEAGLPESPLISD
ncbi:MAG: DUF1289 domain-containing protein [Rhodospirillaceae bacterium]|nr:DUF1289 domain-containing protein [Rhodospirillaceae bacterium]MBT5665770.1 DUF1289 domain-containing protein [Rhodospirillaceae bacterium]MBT5811313.1 DUF1289 domain-containing protein [Rhodospirillaceae bacterium]